MPLRTEQGRWLGARNLGTQGTWDPGVQSAREASMAGVGETQAQLFCPQLCAMASGMMQAA